LAKGGRLPLACGERITVQQSRPGCAACRSARAAADRRAMDCTQTASHVSKKCSFAGGASSRASVPIALGMTRQTAAPQAEQIPLSRLRAAPWNANRVPARVLAKIRRSIQEFGVVENLVARPHPVEPGALEVISGNHRLEIFRDLGFASAPVVVVQLDDAHARLLAQTLNRTRGQDDPQAYARLLDEVLGSISTERALEFLPETETSLERALRLVRLPDADQDAAPELPP